jgi:hypothetical protein
MSEYKIAHIRKQGQDIIIVPVDRSYGSQSQADQNKTRNALQIAATSAGLAGQVIIAWEGGSGRVGTLAPREWSQFCSSLSWPFIARNINKTLTIY